MPEMYVGGQDHSQAGDILGVASTYKSTQGAYIWCVVTSIMLLSTGRVVLTMWTLGVEVERCLWERPPPVGV